MSLILSGNDIFVDENAITSDVKFSNSGSFYAFETSFLYLIGKKFS